MSQLNMYQEVGRFSEVLGTSSVKQLLLLIDRAKTLIKSAITAIEHRDILTKCECISKAQAITSYLHSCLNFDVEGSEKNNLARRLDAIFTHAEKQLVTANTKSSLQKIQENDHTGVQLLQECLQIYMNIQAWWEKVCELQ